MKGKAVNLVITALIGNGSAHDYSAKESFMHRLANMGKLELVNVAGAIPFRQVACQA